MPNLNDGPMLDEGECPSIGFTASVNIVDPDFLEISAGKAVRIRDLREKG